MTYKKLEPFLKENTKLAKSIILFGGWLFYIDENMKVHPKTDFSEVFDIYGNHDHWYIGNKETDFAEVLEENVEAEDANSFIDQYMHLAKYRQ